jgi:hypothetical protein
MPIWQRMKMLKLCRKNLELCFDSPWLCNGGKALSSCGGLRGRDKQVWNHILISDNLANVTKGRFELFLDLLYVAILANFAEDLAAHPTGTGVVKYIVSFLNHVI